MKTIKLLSIVFFSLFAFDSFAVAPHPTPHPDYNSNVSALSEMTIENFLSLDIKNMKQANGKKLKWTHRMALGMTQKKMARKVRKGKLDKTAKFATVANPANKRGRLSLILTVGGFLLLFVPVAGIATLGFLASLVGFGFGLSGIRKDEDNTMAIVGTIVGGTVILLTLIAIIWLSVLVF